MPFASCYKIAFPKIFETAQKTKDKDFLLNLIRSLNVELSECFSFKHIDYLARIKNLTKKRVNELKSYWWLRDEAKKTLARIEFGVEN